MKEKRFLIHHPESDSWFEVFGEENLKNTLESEPTCSEVTGISEHEEKFRNSNSSPPDELVNLSSVEVLNGLKEALDLLSKAGPNPLLINESEYWARYEKLTDKYFEKDKDEDE